MKLISPRDLSALVHPPEPPACDICRGQSVIECVVCRGAGVLDWEAACMEHLSLIDKTDTHTPERRQAIRAMLALHDSEDAPCVCPACKGDAIQLCECQK